VNVRRTSFIIQKSAIRHAKPVITANSITSAASGAAGVSRQAKSSRCTAKTLDPKTWFPPTSARAGKLDNCLARTLVYFDGVPAPLIYSSAG